MRGLGLDESIVGLALESLIFDLLCGEWTGDMHGGGQRSFGLRHDDSACRLEYEDISRAHIEEAIHTLYALWLCDEQIKFDSVGGIDFSATAT